MQTLRLLRPIAASSFTRGVAATTSMNGRIPSLRASPARLYRTVPDLDSIQMPRADKASDDFLSRHDLDATYAALGTNHDEVSSRPDKWRECVQRLNLMSRTEPVCQMHDEHALALLIALLRAGQKCGVNSNCADFALLPINLTALAHLSFPEADRTLIREFSHSAVQAAISRLPCSGADFVVLSASDRKQLLGQVMQQMLLGACQAGLTVQSEDIEMTRLGFGKIGLHNGAFAVDRRAYGRILVDTALDRDDLGDVIARTHCEAGYASADQHADHLLASVISTMAHELYHAFQYSQLACDEDSDHAGFCRAWTNMLSISACKFIMTRDVDCGLQSVDQQRDQPLIVFPHERGSWHTSFEVMASLSQSTAVHSGVRDAAASMLKEPRNTAMQKIVNGEQIPPIAIFEAVSPAVFPSLRASAGT